MASRINREEVLNLHKKGKSNKDIADILKRDPHAIGKVIKNLNLKPNGSGRDVIEIENIDIIIGTLLGDSCLKFGSAKYPALCFNHSSKQEEYFFYKMSFFKNLSTKSLRVKYSRSTNYGDLDVFSFNTKYLKCLNFLEKEFYINRVKIIPLDLIKKYFTGRSLAFLFMDDGNINGKTVNLNLQNFSKDETELFLVFLYEKFNLKWTLQKNGPYYRLYLKQESVERFISIVSPYIIKSMDYKLPMSSLNTVNLGKS